MPGIRGKGRKMARKQKDEPENEPGAKMTRKAYEKAIADIQVEIAHLQA